MFLPEVPLSIPSIIDLWSSFIDNYGQVFVKLINKSQSLASWALLNTVLLFIFIKSVFYLFLSFFKKRFFPISEDAYFSH
jgi:hypothetical protein